MWCVIYRVNPDGSKERWTMKGEIESKQEAENKVKQFTEKYKCEFTFVEE